MMLYNPKVEPQLRFGVVSKGYKDGQPKNSHSAQSF